MTLNRVHLLELRHMNITESSDLALWLRNLATSDTISRIFFYAALLFLSLSRKLDFDS
jgi:hypothetical protein